MRIRFGVYFEGEAHVSCSWIGCEVGDKDEYRAKLGFCSGQLENGGTIY